MRGGVHLRDRAACFLFVKLSLPPSARGTRGVSCHARGVIALTSQRPTASRIVQTDTSGQSVIRRAGAQQTATQTALSAGTQRPPAATVCITWA